MPNKYLVLVPLGSCLLIAQTQASQIRFDVDERNNEITESGFNSIIVETAPANMNGDGGGAAAWEFAAGGVLQIGVDGGNTRVRSVNASVPLGDMLRDFSFSNNNSGSGQVTVDIDVLLAGTYEITTYHQDIDEATGEPQPLGVERQFDIRVLDALGTREVVSDALWSPTGETYLVNADGVNRVEVIVQGDNPGSNAWLNGLDIRRIPEPAAIVLATCGFLGCCIRWGRNNRRIRRRNLRFTSLVLLGSFLAAGSSFGQVSGQFL